MTNTSGALPKFAIWFFAVLASAVAGSAVAADYPAPKEADFIAKDFHFHDGSVMAELRQHYVTIGDPSGVPVLVLHGTAGSGMSMVTAGFAGELFGAGQPLDATKYFIILPDAIGTGRSSKPSDGLGAKFPAYNYDDMVLAQYRLVTEGLGLKHLRLVIGNSMGGMQTWLWGTTHPGFADILVPMAAQPSVIAGRNWAMRRMMLDIIKADPDWKDGSYSVQPKSVRLMNAFYGLGTNGGTLGYQALAGTHAGADKLVADRLAAPFTMDANDFVLQWDASRDYDPSAKLEGITSTVLAINSADDERNPPETGIMDRAVSQLKRGRVYLIPASSETRGHGTTVFARFYKAQLADVMQVAPKLP